MLKFCSILDSSTLGSTMGLWHDGAWLRLADELLWRNHRPSFEAWMRHATRNLLIAAHEELRTGLAVHVRQRVTRSGPDTSDEQAESCARCLFGPGCVFELTSRKADGTSLGLQCDGHNGVLFIKRVCPHGAVEALNRLCAGTHREVRPGDLIVKVNDMCCNTASMVEECRKERLVRLTLVRGPQLSRCSLHADAPEFVPGKRWPPHHEEEQQLEIAEERRPGITYHTLSKSTKTIQKQVEAALRAQGISSGKWLFLAL